MLGLPGQQGRQLWQERLQAEGRGRAGAERRRVVHGHQQQRRARLLQRVGEQQIARLVEVDRALDEVRDGGHDRHRPARVGGEDRHRQRRGRQRHPAELPDSDQRVLPLAIAPERQRRKAVGVHGVEREALGVDDAAEARARVDAGVEERGLLVEHGRRRQGVVGDVVQAKDSKPGCS